MEMTRKKYFASLIIVVCMILGIIALKLMNPGNSKRSSNDTYPEVSLQTYKENLLPETKRVVFAGDGIPTDKTVKVSNDTLFMIELDVNNQILKQSKVVDEMTGSGTAFYGMDTVGFWIHGDHSQQILKFDYTTDSFERVPFPLTENSDYLMTQSVGFTGSDAVYIVDESYGKLKDDQTATESNVKLCDSVRCVEVLGEDGIDYYNVVNTDTHFAFLRIHQDGNEFSQSIHIINYDGTLRNVIDIPQGCVNETVTFMQLGEDTLIVPVGRANAACSFKLNADDTLEAIANDFPSFEYNPYEGVGFIQTHENTVLAMSETDDGIALVKLYKEADSYKYESEIASELRYESYPRVVGINYEQRLMTVVQRNDVNQEVLVYDFYLNLVSKFDLGSMNEERLITFIIDID